MLWIPLSNSTGFSELKIEEEGFSAYEEDTEENWNQGRGLQLKIRIYATALGYGNSRTSECGLDLEIQINTFSTLKVKGDHRSKFSNLSNWKEEAWKNQGFNGIRTLDLRDTGAMLYQLSYDATHWARGKFIEFKSSRAVKWCEV